MKRTLPVWSQGWNYSLDLIRKTIRNSAELKRLGEVAGPLRLYTAEEAETIRAAVEARLAARKPVAAA